MSLALLGAALGAVIAGRLADRFGRPRAMVFAAIAFLIQSFGVGLAFTIYDFTFWRIVGGVAVGAASVIAPTYIAEIAPARIRGRLGSLQQLAIVIGIFIALLVDLIIAALAGGASKPWLLGLPAWRFMFISEYGLYTLAAVLSIFFVAAFVRETRGRELEAMRESMGELKPAPTSGPSR